MKSFAGPFRAPFLFCPLTPLQRRCVRGTRQKLTRYHFSTPSLRGARDKIAKQFCADATKQSRVVLPLLQALS
ncbi:hypothetical protein CWO91_19435 [Bradyrhizobium genosp. SA-3]|nr:hypothetical protein CWO91_19435 [Bradyrhizobium genosp. SA-3]